ncbi:DNA methyltransferase [Sphaerospermopsis torques-reginae]|uniref:site-specific DNA-methyltransferase (cytosine-N(4)-specific) n=1 Tax=Sphaerospermopsis torques-reginae ITEP-024 TaxID=984208 RepID=A0ABX8X063_9CYAN|nr:DNA methyltransferase [Sphaerospermopsis torques-reginae]QYX31972.1 site-specific DNA-methyltransferase [Sphaerospermopsis torques-reginae ITEP-024]
MNKQLELAFLENSSPKIPKVFSQSSDHSSTFVDNMKLPVHRWFRYSAGFSGQWVENIIIQAQNQGEVKLLDPFAGSGTTLIASEKQEVECLGIEAHPFVARIARTKLLYKTDVDSYIKHINRVIECAANLQPDIDKYPKLIHDCFSISSLESLDKLRQSWKNIDDSSPESQLVWLTLVAILRHVSHAGTAPWQYILPNKKKQSPLEPRSAFQLMAENMATDMIIAGKTAVSSAKLIQSDARTCQGVPDNFANLIITSPPYANNYDYADATRLEMCFLKEIDGWGDLQNTVRKYLIRSCSQHVTSKNVNLDAILSSPELEPIRYHITKICHQLSQERLLHGGKKNYHLMIACYFFDMAQVWIALRRVCKSPSKVCFVIGDSAPYGIYVPVIEWMGLLAISAGFESFEFDKIRDRNVKWKNRKHNVPLCEGYLWVQG